MTIGLLDLPYLTVNEVGWLLGLATDRRKKREKALERMERKPGQSQADYDSAHQKVWMAFDWAKTVEEHLIVMIGDQGNTLRPDYQERYLELKERLKEPRGVDCPLHGPQHDLVCIPCSEVKAQLREAR